MLRHAACSLAGLLGLFAAVLLFPGMSAGQGLEYVKANYTKFEYRIPMRDGKRLFTAVYVPKDSSQKWPLLLSRTPYSVKPYGADQYRADLGPSPLFGKEGYIFVYQDVRGRWMSEGEFVNMRPQLSQPADPQAIDESTDAFDTIEWLVHHLPSCNGRVGMWGISYPGFYTAAGVINAHPALLAASPQAPINDWFQGDDWHHNGAFFLPHMFNFMAKFGYERPEPTKKFEHPFDHDTPDGYEFFRRLGPLSNANARYFHEKIPFWNEAMQHGNYDDFWQSRNLRPHLKDIRPAVMTVGGWFDAENLFGALHTYKSIEAHSPASAGNTLVMGPWRHGQWARDEGSSLGHVPFNAKTAEFYREKIEFPFFQFHLKQQGKLPHPEAWVFETGTNQWKQYTAWPPAESRLQNLYFQANEGLSLSPPKEAEPGPGFDTYVSDPAKPTPFIDWTDIGMPAEYMLADQRFASRRTDVLVYQTPELEADLTLAGPIEVDLVVSTTGSDSDWVVKLIDVYPDDYPDPAENPTRVRMGGFQQLVRGDVMRGKFRNSLSKPEPFEPGQPTRVRFTLPDTSHCFRSGHRIMVQVQSSWFPLVDRNPQTFVDIYQAKEADFQTAIQRVYRTPEQASRVQVRVLP
ncbi:CocE/NonD family hydrolase [Lignipirellula cremea]|uniref:Cocaine esterase n=1 Tax=Lignipirellula cremea TaxID=2528010 RepID=A0A518DTN0_9BACT|nr:CocE/NonD family hydrolase [Lignipirellula cremea]QDU95201.1 Cocaine esterase [Lignipirellula cremea]